MEDSRAVDDAQRLAQMNSSDNYISEVNSQPLGTFVSAEARAAVADAPLPQSPVDTFIVEVAETYKGDPSGAGVVLAFIPNKAQFYGSVCRYTQAGGKGKEVVSRAYGATASGCMQALAAAWRARV